MSSPRKVFAEHFMAIASNIAYGAYPNRINSCPSIQKLLLLFLQLLTICHTRSPNYHLSAYIASLANDAYIVDCVGSFWKCYSSEISFCLQILLMLLSHKVFLINIFGIAVNIANLTPHWLKQLGFIWCASYYIIRQRLIHPTVVIRGIQSLY